TTAPIGASSSAAPATPVLTATTTTARLPVALSRVVAAALTGHVIIAGGLDAQQHTTPNTEIFDPATMSVRAGGQLPTAVHDAAAGVIGGKALVVGGGAATSVNTVQAVEGNGTATLVGHLPQVRSDDAVATTGNTLYVVGGYDGTRELPGVLATTDGT